MSADKDEVPVFNLQSAGHGFTNRTKDVFGNLQVLEKKHLAYQKERETLGEVEEDERLWKTDPDEDVKKANNVVVQREDEAYDQHVPKRQRPNDYSSSADRHSFKRPELPKPRRFVKFTPDFKKNPEKWTKYTLEDVDAGDMSERSNTKAALAFLEERRKLREGIVEEERDEEMLKEGACSKKMISFTKPVKDGTKETLFKKPRKKKVRVSSSSAGSAVDLSYLGGEKDSEAAEKEGAEKEDADDADVDDDMHTMAADKDTADADGSDDVDQARSGAQPDTTEEKLGETDTPSGGEFKGRRSQKRNIRMRYYEEEEENDD